MRVSMQQRPTDLTKLAVWCVDRYITAGWTEVCNSAWVAT